MCTCARVFFHLNGNTNPRTHKPTIPTFNNARALAIRAEGGDFSEVQRVLRRLADPYALQEGEDLQRPPVWACELGVSCSS